MDSHRPLYQTLNVGSECLARIDGERATRTVVGTAHQGYENGTLGVVPVVRDDMAAVQAPRELPVCCREPFLLRNCSCCKRRRYANTLCKGSARRAIAASGCTSWAQAVAGGIVSEKADVSRKWPVLVNYRGPIRFVGVRVTREIPT